MQLLVFDISEKTEISLLGLRNFSTTIFWRSTFNRKFFTARLNRLETKTDVEKNKFSAPVERTQKIEETINGTYIYDGSDAKCKISVFGDQWVGSFSVVSGFGDEYDASQAEFQTGVVRNNEIFDESGLVKIGYIEEKNLTTTVGGQYITLKRKN